MSVLSPKTRIGALFGLVSQGALVIALQQATAQDMPDVSVMQTPGRSVTLGWTADTHTRPGQSDKQGDLKQVNVAVRDGKGWVYGLETGLKTPQFARLGQSHDTGSFVGVIGRETTQYGAYLFGGMNNGPVTPYWQDVVKWSHGGHARTSPSSSGMHHVFGAAARVDRDYSLLRAGKFSLNASSAVFATLRTDEVSAGAGAFVSVNYGEGASFRPNLPGFPLFSQETTLSVYSGITGKARAYDLPTEKLDTNMLKATGVFGASVSIKGVTVAGEYQHDLTRDIKNPMIAKPVDRFMMSLGAKF